MNSRQSIMTRANDPRLGTSVGSRSDSTIVVESGGPGLALFGGYYALPPGRYRAIAWLDADAPLAGGGFMEITVGAGAQVVNRAAFDAANIPTEHPFIDIDFELFAFSENVEARIYARADARFTLVTTELVRLWTATASTVARPPIWRLGKGLRPLRILYYSCHEILEYDEIRMFTNHGHSVFSLGSFTAPNAKTILRRSLPQFFTPGDFERYQAEGMTAEMAASFDLAIVMHQPEKVAEILAIRPDMPVIYRSIGQSNRSTEDRLRPYAGQIKVVRYSKREQELEGFLGADSVIYFAKNLADFNHPWEGGSRVLTFHNNYQLRDEVSIPSLAGFLSLASRLPCELYGVGNEVVHGMSGVVTPQQQLDLYRTSALYLYVYTIGPSYTLSLMEAMGSGLPPIAPTRAMIERTVKHDLLTVTSFKDGNGRYEVEDLLLNEPALLYSSVDEAHEKIEWLLGNPAYRAEISVRLRTHFAEMFDENKIIDQWNDLMYSMV